jgi:RNA polymerase sigma-70 factor (ECF subfamily)
VPEENLHGVDPDPDELLVRRARRGDQEAFAALVERHRARLFTLAARTLGSRTDAEDVVQEALVRAWRSLPRFRGGSRFSTWLYRITVNCAHDAASRRRPEPAEAVAEREDPRDRIVEAELSGALQQALDRLEEPYRVAVVMYDVLGCSYAEIAEATGVPEGTVKSRIFRGRRDLAAALGTSTEAERSKG